MRHATYANGINRRDHLPLGEPHAVLEVKHLAVRAKAEPITTSPANRQPLINHDVARSIACQTDHHPHDRRSDPEDIDLGAIKTDLDFLIERTERFRKEQAFKPLYILAAPQSSSRGLSFFGGAVCKTQPANYTN